jgi:regulator of sigma E protease
MEALNNLAAFIPVIGIVIFVHEFGHFITAKAFGMRVFIFSFGFGKRLLGFKWGDTDCRLSLIPLGGYVKLEGEADDNLSEDVSLRGDGKDFTARPRWQRFVVYLAGPFMNAVLTVSVLTALYMIGFQVDGSVYDRPIVGAVDADSPAARAGLLVGDEIVAIDGARQKTWEDAQYNVLIRPNARVEVRVLRDGKEEALVLQSGSTAAEKVGTIGVYPLVRVGDVLAGRPAAAAGLKTDDAILKIGDQPIRSFGDIPPLVGSSADKPITLQIWRDGTIFDMSVTPKDDGSGARIGVGPKLVVKRFGFTSAVKESVAWSVNMTKQTFQILGRLVTAQISPKTMMGPLGIAKASGDAARAGIGSMFYLVAVISLQIGIMNLFPLPPLDGGHLAILAGEGLLRRDFTFEVKAWIMNAGAMVLFLLIGLVLYSDLSKTSLLGRFLP